MVETETKTDFIGISSTILATYRKEVKEMEKEAREKTAAPAEEIQEQQYTADEVANKVIETMFAAFAKTTSHGIFAEVYG